MKRLVDKYTGSGSFGSICSVSDRFPAQRLHALKERRLVTSEFLTIASCSQSSGVQGLGVQGFRGLEVQGFRV